MYKVLEKNNKSVKIEMDLETFKYLEKDFKEWYENYEFVFDEPIKASNLIIS